ncbi:hypothetical protein BAE44_0025692 [Dichanthelium oligosanthes]|uniref:Uncharacterized protein n=1 Tax=Dichanthelium oligosanthes TaxID=888268 RepID=A0A1E5UK82_9POAL|nr:hypothetical protein BAE44_0025692 [Dichanthelium oligosanthes]
MARSVHRLLPLLLAASLLRLQVSDCSSSSVSSPPAQEPRKPAEGVHGNAPHHQQLVPDAEARTARPSIELADYDGKNSADDGGAAPLATPVARADDGGVVVASRPRQATSGRALVRAGLRRPAVLLCSTNKLARRLLAAAADVEDDGTNGAGPSCHSSSVHINCPPPPHRRSTSNRPGWL